MESTILNFEPEVVSDTIALRSPIVAPDEEVLKREKILPGGAGGPFGGPYKMLRTQVLRRLDKLGANSVAIVGTAPGTGKTLTAINLAIAISAELQRTALLVDLDLRNPSVHRRLGFEPRIGIEDCLRRGSPLRDAMVRLVGYERLVVLPARETCVDSSELLSSDRTREVIDELRKRYSNRVLVFDLPPVLQADDALAFVRHVQSGLMVVSEGRTRRDDLVRAVELLRDLPILGSVLNGSSEAVDTYY
jgi:Mrp family chromosome partitioning ATPase